MKIRTVYFKVRDMEKAVAFWQGFFEQAPPKKSPYWSEFKSENINFGLLWDEEFQAENSRSNFVPVFEFKPTELEAMKDRAILQGAKILVDIKNHPDQKSYVLCDPFGNEFEITKFHD
jgi:predicted enzyme related to lactoylglutathione lyase